MKFKIPGLKKIDILLLRSYVGPFAVTFFLSMFLFLMQFLWKFIDELVGKGIAPDLLAIQERPPARRAQATVFAGITLWVRSIPTARKLYCDALGLVPTRESATTIHFGDHLALRREDEDLVLEQLVAEVLGQFAAVGKFLFPRQQLTQPVDLVLDAAVLASFLVTPVRGHTHLRLGTAVDAGEGGVRGTYAATPRSRFSTRFMDRPRQATAQAMVMPSDSR